MTLMVFSSSYNYFILFDDGNWKTDCHEQTIAMIIEQNHGVVGFHHDEIKDIIIFQL